jgi:hypothetical protein
MKQTIGGVWLVCGVLAGIWSGAVAQAQTPLWIGDWYPEFDIEMVADDNINRSFDGNGEKSDVVFRPVLRLEQQYPMEGGMIGVLGGELVGAVHGRYNKLNYMAPGVSAGVRRPVGAGEQTPVLSAGLRLKYEFHEQDARYGAEVNPRLEAELPFGAALTGMVFYEYDNRFASENPVYDRDGHTVGFQVDMAVTEQVALVAGYHYRMGDVLVHQPRTDLGEEIRGERLPLDTFKDRYDAVGIKDETTHRASVGMEYAVSIYTSLRAGLAYEEIKADGDKYPSMQFILGFTHLL